MKVIVYTASVGPRSKVKEFDFEAKEYSYHAFVWPYYDLSSWESHEAEIIDCDMRRCARWYKANPHLLFDCDISIWMDASLTPAIEPIDLVNLIPENVDIAAYKHPRRNCTYEEIATVTGRTAEVENPRDYPAILDEQEARYRKEGLPEKAGLWENSILVRRHNEKAKSFNKIWWNEIDKGTREDQVSMPYSILKSGATAAYITPGKAHHNPYVKFVGHSGLPWR